MTSTRFVHSQGLKLHTSQTQGPCSCLALCYIAMRITRNNCYTIQSGHMVPVLSVEYEENEPTMLVILGHDLRTTSNSNGGVWCVLAMP